MDTWIWRAAGSVILSWLPDLACAGTTDSEEYKRRWNTLPDDFNDIVPTGKFIPRTEAIIFWLTLGAIFVVAICVFWYGRYDDLDTEDPLLQPRATASSRSTYSQLGPRIPAPMKTKVAPKPSPCPQQNYYQSEGASYPQGILHVNKKMQPEREPYTASMPQPATAPMKLPPPYECLVH